MEQALLVAPSLSPQLLAGLYRLRVRSVDQLVRGVNRTFKVTTDDAVYFLRLYRLVGRDREQIDAEISAIFAAGDAAAKPIALATGGYVFVCPFEGHDRHAVLFAEAPGRQASPTTDDAGLVASALGNLHRGLQRIYPIGRPLNAEQIITTTCASLHSLGVDFFTLEQEIMALRSPVTEALRSSRDAGLGVCHGDAWLGNVHLSGARATFFDFDDCFDGPIIADVVRLLTSLWDGDATKFKFLADAIACSYTAIHPLGQDDLGLISALAQLDEIGGVGFLARHCTLEPSDWVKARMQTQHSLEVWSPTGRATAIAKDAFSTARRDR